MSKTERMPPEDWKWRRAEVIIRDDYTCQECGSQGGPEGNASLEVHHVTPVAEGGSDNPENLKTLCDECHNTRHQTDAEEYSDAIRKNAPASTKEIADSVGVTRQGADYRLRKLEKSGKVESQMVGNSLLWQMPTGD